MGKNAESKPGSSQRCGGGCQSAEVLYKAAQDSAQHHDHLAWIATGIVWTGSILLFENVLQEFEEKSPAQVGAVAFFGIVLLATLWVLVCGWREIKLSKYAVCRQIEEAFADCPDGWKHHSELHRVRPHGWGMTGAFSIVTGVLIVGWVAVTAVSITLHCGQGR